MELLNFLSANWREITAFGVIVLGLAVPLWNGVNLNHPEGRRRR